MFVQRVIRLPVGREEGLFFLDSIDFIFTKFRQNPYPSRQRLQTHIFVYYRRERKHTYVQIYTTSPL